MQISKANGLLYNKNFTQIELPQENARRIDRVIEMEQAGTMKKDGTRERIEAPKEPAKIPDKYFILSIPPDRNAGWQRS